MYYVELAIIYVLQYLHYTQIKNVINFLLSTIKYDKIKIASHHSKNNLRL